LQLTDHASARILVIHQLSHWWGNHYPDEARAAWAAYLAGRRNESAEVAMDLGRASIEDVNTDYEITGDERSHALIVRVSTCFLPKSQIGYSTTVLRSALKDDEPVGDGIRERVRNSPAPRCSLRHED